MSHEKPEASECILWIFVSMYEKCKCVWIGLDLDGLDTFPVNKSTKMITFSRGVASAGGTRPSREYVSVRTGKYVKVISDGPRVNLEVLGNIVYPKINKSAKVYRTAYVDSVYGCDQTAKLERPNRPFKTINSAIEAIPRSAPPSGPPSDPAAVPVSWVIYVSPGEYGEVVLNKPHISIRGSGEEATFLGKLEILSPGNNTISGLSITDVKPSLLEVAFDSPGENLPIRFSEVSVVRKRLLVEDTVNYPCEPCSSIFINASSGINALVKMINCNLRGHSSCLVDPEYSLLRTTNVDTTIESTDMALTGEPNINNSLIRNENSRIIVEGGKHTLQIVNSAPTTQNQVYTIDNGSTTLHSVDFTGLNTALSGSTAAFQDDQLEYGEVLVKNNNGRFQGQMMNIDIGGFGSPALCDALNESSICSFLACCCSESMCPPILGATSAISLDVSSSMGSRIGTGGSFANARRISDILSPGQSEYFPRNDDYAIIVDLPGVDVVLENPAEVNRQTQYVGKTIVVKNITAGNVTVRGITAGVLVDGPVILRPNNTANFTNDGKVWFIL